MVTILRPSHQLPNINVEYRYQFQAPDNDTYDISWVRFRAGTLESYNWNHLDYYVHTKGDREFPLNENLKYWRVRLLLLPLTPFLSTTKEILDKQKKCCDIYSNLHLKEDNYEGFFRFLDLCVNKIKRKPTERKEMPFPNQTHQETLSQELILGPEEIVQRMKSPVLGIPFIVKPNVFPEDSFISYDAVLWLKQNYNLCKQEAVKKLQCMIDKNFIRHCSGDPK